VQEGIDGNALVEPGKGNIFWIRTDESTGNINITQHMDEHASVSLLSERSPLDLNISVLLFNSDNNLVRSIERTFLFTSEYIPSITFFPPPHINMNGKANCEQLEGNLGDSKIRFTVDQLGAGVALRFFPKDSGDNQISDSAELLFSGGPSFADFAFSEDELAGRYVGRIGMLILYEGVKTLTVNGQQRKELADTDLLVYGDINASYNNEAQLIFSGEARALWLGNQRLNQTKWEASSGEMQIFMVSTFAVLFAWMFRRTSILYKQYGPLLFPPS
jgi:hypothetical protein